MLSAVQDGRVVPVDQWMAFLPLRLYTAKDVEQGVAVITTDGVADLGAAVLLRVVRGLGYPRREHRGHRVIRRALHVRQGFGATGGGADQRQQVSAPPPVPLADRVPRHGDRVHVLCRTDPPAPR